MNETDISTAAVERLLDGVTTGPWRDVGGENGTVNSADGIQVAFYASRANRRFIAASRDLVPALLADRDRLAAEAARLREALIEATDRDFIWGALDNVHDAETTLDDYAASVSGAQRAALSAHAARREGEA